MTEFNAQQARQISDSLYKDELHDILVDIKNQAEKGENILYIYKKLKENTRKELIKRGFEVITNINKESDSHYTFHIKW